jgi:hypothetical protein
MGTTGSRFSKTAKFCLLAGIAGLFSASGIWYVKAIRTPELVDLREAISRSAAKDEEMDPDAVHLSKIPAINSENNHLLDGDFMIVYRMHDISQSCWNSLSSSFANNPGTISKGGAISFADPGQPAQYGDSIIPNAPFRRLVFAGQSPRTCFVYFQHGGADHPSYCLAVIDDAKGKTIWVGEARKKARNLRELRSLLSTHQFDDTSGPAC